MEEMMDMTQIVNIPKEDQVISSVWSDASFLILFLLLLVFSKLYIIYILSYMYSYVHLQNMQGQVWLLWYLLSSIFDFSVILPRIMLGFEKKHTYILLHYNI